MKTLKELIEERKALLDKIDAILDKPESRSEDGEETGELSEEQRKQLDGLKSELTNLDVEIKDTEERAEQREQQRRLEARAAEPRYTGVQGQFSRQERKDIERFSLARTVRLLAEGRGMEALDGVEGEMAQEGQMEAQASGIQTRGRSVMISAKALSNPEYRDMTATGGSDGDQGGMTIATQKMGLLDSLMNALVIRNLGATFMGGLVGNFDMPRIVDGTAPDGKAENATADEYSPTTAQVQFAPNRLPTVVEVSNQLLMQSNERGLTAFLQNHLVRKLSTLMEAAFINGTGTNAAEGILQTSGIGSVVGGANGLAPAWSHIVDLEREVAVDNALLGSLHYLSNSKIVATLKETAKISSTDSYTILDERSGNRLNGYNLAVTNAVPSNLDKGSSTGVCSAIIFGNFVDYTIAQWSGIEFLVNPYSKDDQGLTRINASVYYDGHVIRPQSFAAMQDALTA